MFPNLLLFFSNFTSWIFSLWFSEKDFQYFLPGFIPDSSDFFLGFLHNISTKHFPNIFIEIYLIFCKSFFLRLLLEFRQGFFSRDFFVILLGIPRWIYFKSFWGIASEAPPVMFLRISPETTPRSFPEISQSWTSSGEFFAIPFGVLRRISLGGFLWDNSLIIPPGVTHRCFPEMSRSWISSGDTFKVIPELRPSELLSKTLLFCVIYGFSKSLSQNFYRNLSRTFFYRFSYISSGVPSETFTRIPLQI